MRYFPKGDEIRCKCYSYPICVMGICPSYMLVLENTLECVHYMLMIFFVCFFFQNLCKNVPIFIMDLFRFFCLFLLFYELRYVDSVMFSKNQLQIFSNFFFLILSICCNLHDRLSHTELTLFFFAKFLSLYGRLLIGYFSCLFFFFFIQVAER